MLTDNGKIYSFGENHRGQCGIKRNENLDCSVLVATPIEEIILQADRKTERTPAAGIYFHSIAAGKDHSLASSKECEVYACGNNDCG